MAIMASDRHRVVRAMDKERNGYLRMRCEDYPCCGHEANDCDGTRYGSDESIKAHAMAHADCAHDAGYCALIDDED